jgi:hypothetical protein
MRSSSSSTAGSAAGRRRRDVTGDSSDDLSRYSVATTTASSAPSGRSSASGSGRAAAILDAFRSCFAPADARLPETSFSDDFVSDPSQQRTCPHVFPFLSPIPFGAFFYFVA